MRRTTALVIGVMAMTMRFGTGEANAQCAQCEGDFNNDGKVLVNELVKAVNNALAGCPPTPTPTTTITPTPTSTSGPEELRAARVSNAPVGIDDPVWESIAALAPTLDNMGTGLLYGDGQLNMSGTFSGLLDFNDGEAANLSLRAVHDGDNLYILAEWDDSVFNVDRRRWRFNGPTDPLKPGESADGWTSQLNDDKIALAFEIDPASSEFGTFASVGCAAACHNVSGSGLDMRPEQGKVDIWHWKTSRSEPLGHVDDQVTDPNGRVDDSGAKLENRNTAGNNRSGPDVEWDGTPQMFERWDGQMITLDPAYFILDGHSVDFAGDAAAGQTTYATSCSGCHGNAGQGGIGPALTNVALTGMSRQALDTAMAAAEHPGNAAYNALSADDKTNVIARLRGMSGIPGYFLTQPSGSIADIETASNVEVQSIDAIEHQRYRLLMRRALNTGNSDDAQFTPGGSYPFGVALMDNDGRNHIGSRLEMLTLDE